MSSYLSKSKKDFKPKAPPARRPGNLAEVGGASSRQSSVRASAERQTHTPQPQPTLIISAPTTQNRNVSDSPVPHLSENTDALVDHRFSPVEPQQSIPPRYQRSQEQISVKQPIPATSPTSQARRPSPRSSPHRARHTAPAQPIGLAESTQPHSTEDIRTQVVNQTRLRSSTPTPLSSGQNETPPLPTFDQDEETSQHPTKRRKIGVLAPAGAALSLHARSDDLLANMQVLSATPIDTGTLPATAARATDTTHDNISSSQATPIVAAGAASVDAAETNEQGAERPQGTKPKRRRKRESKQQRLQRIADEIVEAATGGNGQIELSDETVARKKRRKTKRAGTPEDAESLQIRASVVTMSELTKDLRQGKKSSRESRLRERDREELARNQGRAQEQARQQAEQATSNGESAATGDSAAGPMGQDRSGMAATTTATPIAATEGPSSSGRTRSPPIARIAPQVRLVNGQIVQDEESRMIDRHGAAAALRASEDDVRVEDELTRHVNAGSYMKREAHSKWTVHATELFYDGLRMFGTDFMTISKMFPRRSRRQIKLKFNKEERADREKVRRALMLERRPADLREFERLAGEAYPDPALLEENMRNDRLRLEEEQRKEVEAMEQLVRQRERDAAAESGMAGAGVRERRGSGVDESSAKENEENSRADGQDGDEANVGGGENERGRRLTRTAEARNGKQGRLGQVQSQLQNDKSRTGTRALDSRRTTVKAGKAKVLAEKG